MARRKYILRGSNGPEEVTVETGSAGYRVHRGGRVESVEVRRLPDGRVSLLFEDGRQLSGRGVSRPDRVEVSTARGITRVALADPLRDRLTSGASHPDSEDRHEEVRSLMPGRVVQVCVRPGERVEQGALLLVLEAMKMQNEIRSSLAGGVETVLVADGQPVEAGALLLSIRA
jgi:biotin carboxyl carrier protein